MAKSFRRILLSRLLLLSVPIIVLGVSTTYWVTYRKARSGLLETARQNLTESAVRRGKKITDSITALKSNLITASQHVALKSSDGQQYSEFLEQLSQQLPTNIECLQLIDARTKEILESTCDRDISADIEPSFWPQQQQNSLLPFSSVNLQPILPKNTSDSLTSCQRQAENARANQLPLLASVPIYNAEAQLSSILVARSAILETRAIEPGSLSGSTAIIDREGTILAHPCRERIGRNITQESQETIKRLQGILRKAQAGEQNYLHLFSFEQEGLELLTGYTGIPNPISEKQGQAWVVLTMTPLQNALAALDEIRRVLLNLLLSLTIVLILGTIAAILYVARDMARPLEDLRNAVLNQDPLQQQAPIPHNFIVHEFNQLARTFNDTLNHIRDSYELVNRTLEKAMKTATNLRAAEEKLQTSLQAEKSANEKLEQAQQELQKALKAERLSSERLRTVLLLIFDQFGNPLNGIMLNLNLFKEDFKDGLCEIGEENEEIELAYQSAILLYERLQKISKMFSIADNKFFADIQPIDLRNIVNKIYKQYLPIIRENGLEFNIREWQDRELMIYADPEKLTEVLNVLIDNAIRYTESGQITIKTHIENVDRQTQKIKLDNDEFNGNSFYATGQKACILIRDTGCGMNREQIERLNNPRTNTGLSLVMTRIIMEIMDGTMSIESEGKGKGTGITLYLPTAKKYNLG